MSNATSTHRLYGLVDLLALVALLAGFDALVMLTERAGALRIALGLPVLLFVPGYALVAALYPRGTGTVDEQRPRASSPPARGRTTSALGPIARVGASVLASVALVAAAALAVNASPWLIRPVPLLVAITVVTLAAVAAALYRRTTVPRHLRYHPAVPWRSGAGAFRPRLSAAFLLGLVFLASVGAGAAVLGGHAGPAPADTGGPSTGLAVLTGSGDGDYVAANYTDTIAADRPLYFRVTNHGETASEYTVVAVRQTVAVDGNRTTVASVTERDRLSLDIGAGESALAEFDPRPAQRDQPQRLVAYIYRGDAPDSPSRASAVRTVQVWYDDDPHGGSS